MRRGALGLLLWLGLVPFMVGASPDAGPSTTPPSVCAGLPAGARLIDGLTTGQVTTSGDAVTLGFSNEAFACGAWLTEISSQGCHDDWAFTLTVPASALRPGIYNLSDLSAQFGELYGLAGTPYKQGCANAPCTFSTRGIGSIAVTQPAATLEIQSPDAQCITGVITGLTDIFPDAPDHNGAFFALPCGQ